MTINVERDYELVTLKITGRLDTTTTPNLETVINELSDSVKELVFNVSEIEYISSSGIRAMLKAYKKMTSNHGIMRIEQVNSTVREAFEMMGLAKMIG